MPFKFETERMTIAKSDDKRVKLTADDKAEMKRMYELGGWSYNTLGAEFGVSEECLLRCKSREEKGKLSKES